MKFHYQLLRHGRRLLPVLAFITSASFGQTRRTDIASGSLNSSPTSIQVYNGNIYFLARYSSTGSTTATDKQEWFRFNPSTSVVTQLTTDHTTQPSGNTTFRPVSRIGNNIFVSSSKGNSGINLEFSRFDLTTETEQWQDLYTGNNGGTPAAPNTSDPITYGVDPATGYVYFAASVPTYGYQLHYWKPTDNSITRLTALNLSWPGIGQNSSAGIVVMGNYVYTTVSIGNSSSLTNYLGKIDKTTGDATIFSGVSPAIINPTSLRLINNKIYFAARSGSSTGPVNLYCYNPASEGDPVKLTNYTQTTADGNLGGFFTGGDGMLYVNVIYYNTSPTQGQLLRVNTADNSITTYDGGGGATPVPNTYAFTTATDLFVTELVSGKRDIVKYNLATKARMVVATGKFTAASGFFLASNKKVYFNGNDGTNGSEPWVIDLVNNTVSMVSNVNPGAGNGAPGNFMELSGQLYFSANDGSNGSEFYSYTLPAATLPLTLTAFYATATAKGVELVWSVENQVKMREFVVERSNDGRQFSAVGVQQASTNRDEVYRFTDPNPGSVNYYRLRLVNSDNSYNYSVQRRLQWISGGRLLVYPNPVVDGNLLVQLSGRRDESVTYTLFTVAGAFVQSGTLRTGQNPVRMTSLSPGTYVLQVSSGESITIQKF